MNQKPTKIKILGITYAIEYTDNPAEVDIWKRESLWGQIDYWTRTIRIYDNNSSIEDIWQTLIHEIFHCIITEMHLDTYETNIYIYEKAHRDLDRLSLAWRDFLFSNGILKGD